MNELGVPMSWCAVGDILDDAAQGARGPEGSA
jgi:hypothetical protein